MPPPLRSQTEIAHEIEQLEDLLRSEGWGVFSARVLAEWQNEGYFGRMTTAMASPDPVTNAKVIHLTAIQVQGMLDWPKKRIENLRKGLT